MCEIEYCQNTALYKSSFCYFHLSDKESYLRSLYFSILHTEDIDTLYASIPFDVISQYYNQFDFTNSFISFIFRCKTLFKLNQSLMDSLLSTITDTDINNSDKFDCIKICIEGHLKCLKTTNHLQKIIFLDLLSDFSIFSLQILISYYLERNETFFKSMLKCIIKTYKCNKISKTITISKWHQKNIICNKCIPYFNKDLVRFIISSYI
jgi:hypothetical protein